MKTGSVVPVDFVSQSCNASKPFALEALEPRRLMSAATATLGEDGVLLIRGTEGRDLIDLGYSARNGSLCVNIIGHASDAGWIGGPDDFRMFFVGPDVRQIRVEASGGDDAVVCQGWFYEGVNLGDFDIPLYVDGGAGDDTIGGAACADTLIGGAGEDWIDADSASSPLGTYMFNVALAIRETYYRDLPALTGAVLNDKGQGDLLYADDIPPEPAMAQPAEPAPATESLALVTPPPAAPGAPSRPAFFDGDDDALWGDS
jgi:hypothetical protein